MNRKYREKMCWFSCTSTAETQASVHFGEEGEFNLLEDPVCQPVPLARDPVVQGQGAVPLGVEVEVGVARYPRESLACD